MIRRRKRFSDPTNPRTKSFAHISADTPFELVPFSTNEATPLKPTWLTACSPPWPCMRDAGVAVTLAGPTVLFVFKYPDIWLPCFDPRCRNSWAGISYVSMTTPQRAVDTKTSTAASLSLLPSLALRPYRLLPVAELSTDTARGPDLWPHVADKEVSVGTSRGRSGLSPGILVPGSARRARRSSLQPSTCVSCCFSGQEPFPEALSGLTSGTDLNLGVCDRMPPDTHSRHVCRRRSGAGRVSSLYRHHSETSLIIDQHHGDRK